jgi:hypothetical protein
MKKTTSLYGLEYTNRSSKFFTFQGSSLSDRPNAYSYFNIHAANGSHSAMLC